MNMPRRESFIAYKPEPIDPDYPVQSVAVEHIQANGNGSTYAYFPECYVLHPGIRDVMLVLDAARDEDGRALITNVGRSHLFMQHKFYYIKAWQHDTHNTQEGTGE